MCSVEGCSKPIKQKGWCAMHYSRWYKHGDVSWEPPTLEQLFWAKVSKAGDCWWWTGACNKAGYGRCTPPAGHSSLAHVRAWELVTGRKEPRGMELDHLCRNTLCVRPDHLELVTKQENLRRQAAAVTHCPSGHPYSGDNLYVQRDEAGRLLSRRCRQCRRDGMRSQR